MLPGARQSYGAANKGALLVWEPHIIYGRIVCFRFQFVSLWTLHTFVGLRTAGLFGLLQGSGLELGADTRIQCARRKQQQQAQEQR